MSSVNIIQSATSSLGLNPSNEGLWSAGFVAVVIGTVGILARNRLAEKRNPIIPDERLTTCNALELLAEFILNLSDNVMLKENRKYIPFVATVFFYVASMNLLGLLPGFSMPTDSFTINLGVALVVFVCYNYWGIREVGIINYTKHLWGPIFGIGLLLFPVEIISHIMRPVSLSIRLFGNMIGDHMVLEVFTDLTKAIIPVIFYGLGTFVSFVQAFVFTLLTMIYIRLAVAHDEGH
ncbi:MAG: F0F1 ATP synthase subunit A [Deltaproteobacteria bacterium]|nr:F0F1 ATP synthase subunit A [Deltaproteobacteria bacterium]